MSLIEIVVGAIAGVLILGALIFLTGLPFKIIWNSIVGAVILWLVNLTGIVAIKITFIHALIVGVFGIPGLIVLLIFLNSFK